MCRVTAKYLINMNFYLIGFKVIHILYKTYMHYKHFSSVLILIINKVYFIFLTNNKKDSFGKNHTGKSGEYDGRLTIFI